MLKMFNFLNFFLSLRSRFILKYHINEIGPKHAKIGKIMDPPLTSYYFAVVEN